MVNFVWYILGILCLKWWGRFSYKSIFLGNIFVDLFWGIFWIWEKYSSVSFGAGKSIFLTRSFIDEINLMIFDSRQITFEICNLQLLWITLFLSIFVIHKDTWVSGCYPFSQEVMSPKQVTLGALILGCPSIRKLSTRTKCQNVFDNLLPINSCQGTWLLL